MHRRLLIFLIFFLSLEPKFLFAAPINGTAAVVAKNVITIREVQFIEATESFWQGDPLPPVSQDGVSPKMVQRVLLREMIHLEMGSPKPSDSVKKQFHKTLRERMSQKETLRRWKELLARFRKSEDACIEQIWKNIEIEVFLQKKVETLTPPVTESDIEQYYKENITKFPNQDFEMLKPKLVATLKQEKMRKGLEDWIRFLREKYQAANLLE